MTIEEALQLQPGDLVAFNNHHGERYGFPKGEPIAVERVERGRHTDDVRIWNYFPAAFASGMSLWTSPEYMDRVTFLRGAHTDALLKAFTS